MGRDLGDELPLAVALRGVGLLQETLPNEVRAAFETWRSASAQSAGTWR